MRNIFILLLTLVTLPLGALNAPDSPDDNPILQSSSTNMQQNARQAVRLGNKNFQNRLNTSGMTITDTNIAILITTGFQPFFDKLNQLGENPFLNTSSLRDQYMNEFIELIQKLRVLLIKNQTQFSSPLLIDEKAADDETLQIVKEAINNGHF